MGLESSEALHERALLLSLGGIYEEKGGEI